MNSLILTSKPIMSQLPGGWEPREVPKLDKAKHAASHISPLMTIVEHLFSIHECEQLIALFARAPQFFPVGVQGKPIMDNEVVGSTRATLWSVELAKQIWEKIKPYVSERKMDEKSATDWWQGDKERRQWQPVMCSPIFRFMKYECEGKHLPHYDNAFIYSDDSLRTLQSVVIYLTSSRIGGETRMISDDQQNLPIWSRNHDDWFREARADEVICQARAIAGNALIFDHKICHDVQTHADKEPRIIIRTDIIFEANAI
ncbi:MAG: 2OG-Fe(II) oxygenase [Pseudomonadota bacterium]